MTVIPFLLAAAVAAGNVSARPVVGGFWGEKYKMLTTKWLPHCIAEMETGEGREITNFTGDKFHGCKWADAYPYNIVEAASLALEIDPGDDAEWQKGQQFLRDTIERWIPLFLAVQEKDGYIDNYTRLNKMPHYRDTSDHEFYVQGYFIEMAIAHCRMTGGKDRRLLDAAIRCADGIDALFGPAPKRTWMNGHPGLELALQRLSDATGEKKYAELARFFVLHQHEGGVTSAYNQSDMPAVAMKEAKGHAVRANYFYTAMARISETQAAAKQIFNGIVDRKMYLTGGVGSEYQGEAYGRNYDLPQMAYAESCAGCGLAFLAQALAPIANREKCETVYERAIYNNILGAVSRDGSKFWYQNPLAGNKPRTAWHGCPCCVGNIPRTLFALKDNVAKIKGHTLYIDQYMSVRGLKVGDYTLDMTTDYPWSGKVTVKTDFPGKILARFPWREESKLYTMTPKLEHGYEKVRSNLPFEFPLVEQSVKADERVVACRGRTAYQTGPIVWSWETKSPDDEPKRVPNYDRLNDGGYAEVWRLDKDEQPSERPLLGGFHPDPSVCTGADGAYYLVTSSFAWTPGLPVYRSTDFRKWTFVGHALRDFSSITPNALTNENDGVWAPTIRYGRGKYWIVFTFSPEAHEKVNCLISADKPEGPWSAPKIVKGCPDKGGIDPSLFFDDDGKVWWQADRMIPNAEKRWRGECMCYLQEIDLDKAELVGPRYDISSGVGEKAKNAEGPHLMKIGKKYLYYFAEGGTDATHAEVMLQADKVTGPYKPIRTNPLITRRDRGTANGLTCTGHMDLVPINGKRNDFYGVFLGIRRYGSDGRVLLSRETFACPFLWRDGDMITRDDALIEGTVENLETPVGVAIEGVNVELRPLRDIVFDVTVEVPPKASAVLYRNRTGYEAWPNETGKTAKMRLVSKDGMTVQAYLDKKPLGKPRDLKALCNAAKRSRFNGVGYGVMSAR